MRQSIVSRCAYSPVLLAVLGAPPLIELGVGIYKMVLGKYSEGGTLIGVAGFVCLLYYFLLPRKFEVNAEFVTIETR